MDTFFSIVYVLGIIFLILYTKGESAITHPKFKACIKKVDNLSIWLVRKSLRSKFTNFYNKRGRLLRRMMIFNFFLMGIVSSHVAFWILLTLVSIEFVLLIIYSTVKPIPVYIANMKKCLRESFSMYLLFIVGISILWILNFESFNKFIKDLLELLKAIYNLLTPDEVNYLLVVLLFAIILPLFPLIWRLIIFALSRVYKLFICICFRLNHRKPIRPAILLGSIIVVIFTKTLEILLQ